MPKAIKPKKPYKGFPLSAHAVGQWCKTINYKTYYFGPWSDWQSALKKYNDEHDRIRAGQPRTADTPTGVTVQPGQTAKGITLGDLVNRFLHVKENRTGTGELAPRTYAMYKRAGVALGEFFGPEREVESLTAYDFERYRGHLGRAVTRKIGVSKNAKPKARNLVSLGNEIRIVKIIFNFAFDQGLIDRPLRLKAWLEGPSDTAKRAENNLKPVRMIEANDLRRALGKSKTHMRAMILLGINCGFGNIDVATLPKSSIDLAGGWIDYPRPKTSIKRRVALWPETVAAIRAALAVRPVAKLPEDADLAFITKYGYRFVRSSDRGAQRDSVAQEFKKLLTLIGITQAGLNFYALRSSFQTVASDSGDEVATSAVMGHAAKKDDMAAVYRRKLTDQRLRKLADHVRLWLWPAGSEVDWLASDDGKAVTAKLAELKPVRKTKPKSKRVPVAKM